MLTTHTFCVTHAHITHSHSHVYFHTFHSLSHLAITTFSIQSPFGSQGCLIYHLTEEEHCCQKPFHHTINLVHLLVTLEKREGACALFVRKNSDVFTNLPSVRKSLFYLFIFSCFNFSFLSQRGMSQYVHSCVASMTSHNPHTCIKHAPRHSTAPRCISLFSLLFLPSTCSHQDYKIASRCGAPGLL